MSAKATQQNDAAKQLNEALKRFCRSVELCDDYLRGYYGLKLVGIPNKSSRRWLTWHKTTKQLLATPLKAAKSSDSDGLSLPDNATIQKLDELATEKLAQITRKYSAGERDWQGYDEAEIAAAKELLEKDASTTVR
jgi:ER membrane protein complex subunit 2